MWPAEGSVVPHNLMALVTQYSLDPSAVKLVELEGMNELPVEVIGGIEVLVVPGEPLVPGLSYRFELPEEPCGGPLTYDFVAGEAAVLPAGELGTLSASVPERGPVSVVGQGMCVDEIEAVFVDLELALAPEFAALEPFLMYETEVDGERWTHQPSAVSEAQLGESWRGRGVDRVFWSCSGVDGDPSGVGPSSGLMTIRMSARFPGLPEQVFVSSEVEVELDCEMEAGETGDEEGESGDDEGGSESGGGEPGEGEGQGCRVEAGRRSAPFTFLAFGLLALARRRRES